MKNTKTPRAAESAQHTPGPWRIDGDTIKGPAMEWPLESYQKRGEAPVRVPAEIVAVLPAGGCGASYRHYPFAVRDANKALIAAAPELLESAQCLNVVLDANRLTNAELGALYGLRNAIGNATRQGDAQTPAKADPHAAMVDALKLSRRNVGALLHHLPVNADRTERKALETWLGELNGALAAANVF